ncbi:galactoside alpha-(1,2)-fucosyltransferase 2-like [Ambystoma mexicanum]|uniref:galactoside alpha-(1,2)-fucosyltransferase 2-like n=1 Tax=Ambystoma mexicanum TaxID=8296 RepID=UPI0037E8019D
MTRGARAGAWELRRPHEGIPDMQSMRSSVKPCTRRCFPSFPTGGLYLFMAAIMLSTVLHIAPMLFRNQPAIQYPNFKWWEDNADLKRTEAGMRLEPMRAFKGIWTVHPIGRLGNLMGQYATLYALAKHNRKQAYILPKMHSELSKVFKITLPVLYDEVGRNINWTLYELHDWMSEEYRDIPIVNAKLVGYPCSWTFYHHVRDDILREFSFHNFIKVEANNYLSKIRGNQKTITFVGVHVRRGDYVHVMPKVWKGVLADKAYLKKAMDYFRDRYTSPVFVVTSNDMEWCRQNINGTQGEVHFAGDGIEGSPGRDFALLAHCNHTIMSIGTFGFWVGYLVSGETVYLANFTLPDSDFLRVFRYEAAYLPHWIGIQADLSPLLRNETQPLAADSEGSKNHS